MVIKKNEESFKRKIAYQKKKLEEINKNKKTLEEKRKRAYLALASLRRKGYA